MGKKPNRSLNRRIITLIFQINNGNDYSFICQILIWSDETVSMGINYWFPISSATLSYRWHVLVSRFFLSLTICCYYHKWS